MSSSSSGTTTSFAALKSQSTSSPGTSSGSPSPRFPTNLLPSFHLERVDTPEGRYYVSPGGVKLDSVTTVLSRLFPTDWLDTWIQRVGVEEAARVSGSASTRGTNIHSMAEAYLKGEDWSSGQMPVNIASFLPIADAMNQHLTEVLAIEHRMYSLELRAAGTTDLLCRWKKRQAVLDFKTSKRQKELGDIESYFIQTGAYGVMAEHLHGMRIESLVILMTVDDGHYRTFEEEAGPWMQKARELMSNR